MHKYILLPSIALLLSVASFAQESNVSQSTNDTSENQLMVNDTVKNKKGEILQEVIITSNQHKNNTTVTRSGIKPMDLPQSLQVVGGEIIQQQQTLRLSDVVKNVNGVYVGSARGGAQESFWSRGYDMSANNMFKNGFRYNSGSIPEVSSLERVEVLKGSSALLYGNVAPGGILNMVTKSPSFKSGGEVSTQTGSNSFYKPSVDVYGPLGDKLAYRFIGSYENSESFRDVVTKERYYINPSFLYRLSNKTEITLQGDYLNDDWTPDFGTGVIGKNLANISRNKYLGASWSNGNTKQVSVSSLVEHDLNSNWKINFNSSLQDYKRTSKATERIQPSANPATYGDWKRPFGQNKNLETILGEQISLQGNFATGKIKHQLFTGADFETSQTDAYTYRIPQRDANGNPKFDLATGNPLFTNGVYDTINIFSYNPNVPEALIPEATVTKIVKTKTNRYGVYAQDLVSITEKIKVLAGLRWSLQEGQVNTHDYAVRPVTIKEDKKRKDLAFSPKVGLVYQPTTSTSLFASYANSFTPNTGSDLYDKALEPSTIDQYEVGVKKDFWKGLLSTNITVYQITNDNLYIASQYKADGSINSDTNIKIWGGATKSKGAEIDITAKPIEGLSIAAGYSYNDMRYTKTSGKNLSFITGDRLVRTPANTANMSFFYTLPSGILKGASFGALANYIGNRSGGWNDNILINSTTGAVTIDDRDIPLKGYTTLDLSAGYSWKKISFLCKLSNVGNVLNYTVHENYSVNPIAPRQIMTTLKYKF